MRCFYLFRSGPVSQLVIRLHVVTLRIKGNLGINARRAQYSMVAAIRYFMIPSNQKIRENRIALLASLEKKSCWDRLNESYFVHKIIDPPNFRGFDWNIENGNISKHTEKDFGKPTIESSDILVGILAEVLAWCLLGMPHDSDDRC